MVDMVSAIILKRMLIYWLIGLVIIADFLRFLGPKRVRLITQGHALGFVIGSLIWPLIVIVRIQTKIKFYRTQMDRYKQESKLQESFNNASREE